MINKNMFNLFKTWKGSFSIGELIPIGFYDVMPGDIFRGGTDFFMRMAPMDAPPLTQLELVIRPYYVPYRQVWEDSEDFFSGGAYGSTPPVMPTVDLITRAGGAPVAESSLANMLGIPTGGTAGKRTVNALPFRVYNRIANHDFIRDDISGLQLTNSVASGNDTTSNLSSIVVPWREDYLTGANPRQQKAESVLLEIERLTNAPGWKVWEAGTNTLESSAGNLYSRGTAGDNAINVGGVANDVSLDPNGGLVLDARDIRDSMMLQRYFENAERRKDNSYSDYIAQVFGVSKQDMRLADPMRLSSTKDTLKFTEVLQTAPTTGGSADGVGNYKGHGIGAARGKGWKQFIPEHGMIMFVAFVRPARVSYYSGMERFWSKTLKEHFFQPELAHMSQQAIRNSEVYADHTTPSGDFAFTDIYDEYRKPMDVTTGGFTSTYDYFHLDRKFTSDQAFNDAFVQCVPPLRIFQDTTADHFYSIAYHNVRAARPIPKTGMPK